MILWVLAHGPYGRSPVNKQHNLALEESSQVVMDLIDLHIDNKIQTLSDEDREESGEYDDRDEILGTFA